MRPYNKNQHTQKLKPGFIASYDIRPGNGVGLFWWNGKKWKSKKIDEASSKGKKSKTPKIV